MKSEQAFGRQPQSPDVLLSLQDGERRGRDLDDVGAALRVEQVGAAELVGKGLAVVAVADHAVDLLRRRVLDAADHLPAAAAQLHRLCHVSSPSPVLPVMFASFAAAHKPNRAFGRINHGKFPPVQGPATLAAPHSLPMSVAKMHGLEDWP